MVCFVYRIVSDCAKATLKQGFSYFGIQFYGECWSGVSKIAYDAVGKSDNCTGPNFKKCDDTPCSYCVGGAKVNYVYKINS